MNVKELIARLQTVDQDLDVLCYTDDENLVAPDHSFRLLEIDEVDVIEGERMRDASNAPTLKLGSGPAASKIACLTVTSDF